MILKIFFVSILLLFSNFSLAEDAGLGDEFSEIHQIADSDDDELTDEVKQLSAEEADELFPDNNGATVYSDGTIQNDGHVIIGDESEEELIGSDGGHTGNPDDLGETTAKPKEKDEVVSTTPDKKKIPINKVDETSDQKVNDGFVNVGHQIDVDIKSLVMNCQNEVKNTGRCCNSDAMGCAMGVENKTNAMDMIKQLSSQGNLSPEQKQKNPAGLAMACQMMKFVSGLGGDVNKEVANSCNDAKNYCRDTCEHASTIVTDEFKKCKTFGCSKRDKRKLRFAKSVLIPLSPQCDAYKANVQAVVNNMNSANQAQQQSDVCANVSAQDPELAGSGFDEEPGAENKAESTPKQLQPEAQTASTTPIQLQKKTGTTASDGGGLKLSSVRMARQASVARGLASTGGDIQTLGSRQPDAKAVFIPQPLDNKAKGPGKPGKVKINKENIGDQYGQSVAAENLDGEGKPKFQLSRFNNFGSKSRYAKMRARTQSRWPTVKKKVKRRAMAVGLLANSTSDTGGIFFRISSRLNSICESNRLYCKGNELK